MIMAKLFRKWKDLIFFFRVEEPTVICLCVCKKDKIGIQFLPRDNNGYFVRSSSSYIERQATLVPGKQKVQILPFKNF